MARERVDEGRVPPAIDVQEEGRPERSADRLALAIALAPIPIALVVSMALGQPPWRPRPHADRAATTTAAVPDPAERPGHVTDPGHR